MHLLESHGYAVVFIVVLLDFLGAPITSIPLIVIAGVMAGAGKLSFPLIVLIGMMAAALGDVLWYALGRVKGQIVLGIMCGITRDRERCVTRSTMFAARYGGASLLVSKFVPGIAAFAPPAAGASGMPLLKFLWLDGTTSLLWAATFSGAGYTFGARAQAWLRVFGEPRCWALLVSSALAASLVGVLVKRGYLVWRRRMVAGTDFT